MVPVFSFFIITMLHSEIIIWVLMIYRLFFKSIHVLGETEVFRAQIIFMQNIYENEGYDGLHKSRNVIRSNECTIKGYDGTISA